MATLHRIAKDHSRVEVVEVKPANPKAGFQLAELYKLLDCQMIEVVYLPDGRLVICDEEGKLKPHVANPEPSRLYANRGGDYIAGSALICDAKELK